MTNAVIDPDLVPPVRHPHMPSLVTITLDPAKVAYIAKRDARHYYTCLGVSPEWKRWLALPGAEEIWGSWRPVHTTWPMGLRTSCMLAQGITDMVTGRAGLPEDRRAHFGRPVPPGPLLSGSILDDACVVYQDLGDAANYDARNWCARLDAEREAVGAEVLCRAGSCTSAATRCA